MRPPAVAGLFYPENANELRHAVNGYIAEASLRAAVAARPKALIVPHAGYQYSGSVAGFAYRRLRDWWAVKIKEDATGMCWYVSNTKTSKMQVPFPFLPWGFAIFIKKAVANQGVSAQ